MRVKINPNLYLGSNELNRMVEGLDKYGYRKLFRSFIQTFGVALVTPNSLRVISGTSGPRFVSVNAGTAIDQNMRLISVNTDQINVMQFPDSIGFRYLRIKYRERTTENGTVNISSDGSLVGNGTEFTKVLRGAPLNQVRIRFPNSGSNQNDYHVLEVIDDNNAVLNASNTLTSESNQKYSVVGCFTPGIHVPEPNKLIFSYDDYELFWSVQAAPDGDSFALARVEWDGSNLSIIDTRLENKLALFDTTEQLVAAITNSVITEYNLVIMQQINNQISGLNSSIQSLISKDLSIDSQIASLLVEVGKKADAAQEDWKYPGETGQPALNNLNWSNTQNAQNRTKFMKTTVGQVNVHVNVTADIDCPFGTQIFTLPEGYRPSTTLFIPAAKQIGTGFPSFVWISISTNGSIFYAEQPDFDSGNRIQFHTSFLAK